MKLPPTLAGLLYTEILRSDCCRVDRRPVESLKDLQWMDLNACQSSMHWGGNSWEELEESKGSSEFIRDSGLIANSVLPISTYLHMQLPMFYYHLSIYSLFQRLTNNLMLSH